MTFLMQIRLEKVDLVLFTRYCYIIINFKKREFNGQTSLMIEVGYWFKQFPFHPMDLAAGPYNPTGLTENRLPKWFFNSKNCLMQKNQWIAVEPSGLKTMDGPRRFSWKLFFLSILGTYRLSHCWIFILQPWTFGSRHHFLLFFFSVSLALSIMVLVTAVSAFFSLRFFFLFWLLFLHFSLPMRFAFALCCLLVYSANDPWWTTCFSVIH